MQILLHADTNSDGSQAMAEHVDDVINGALGRFGDRVSRVEVHLSDADGQAGTSARSIQCTLEARLTGLETVFVTDHADNAHQAIEGGARKLKRAVGAAIAKHDPRHHGAKAARAAEAADSETPGS
jgi:ribosome-associated translation inhibitor RaiA